MPKIQKKNFNFFRELSHSDAKNRKKNFFDFCPLGVTPAGVIEFFGSNSLDKSRHVDAAVFLLVI